MTPIRANMMKNIPTIAPVKSRWRKNAIGSSGCGVRRSIMTKLVRETAAIANAPMISGSLQPR